MKRSLRTDVRNPLLTLPASRKLQALPPEVRAAISELLADLSADSRARAEKCWRTHKAPMAAYWKAVAVYAGHARKLVSGPAAKEMPHANQAADLFEQGRKILEERKK